jgi:hypothetical protein
MNSVIHLKVDAGISVEGNDKFVTYETISTAVDGYVQAVDLSEKYTLWVNEEGKLRDDLVLNPIGTMVWNRYFGKTDAIYGNALITGCADEDGETLSLTAHEVYAFLEDLMVGERNETDA